MTSSRAQTLTLSQAHAQITKILARLAGNDLEAWVLTWGQPTVGADGTDVGILSEGRTVERAGLLALASYHVAQDTDQGASATIRAESGATRQFRAGDT